MAEPRPRCLQPGYLVMVGDDLWVVDRVQPVAVVLDPTAATPVDIVSWPEVPPALAPSPPAVRQVRRGPDGLWVQEPGGPVVLIGRAGLRSAHHSDGLTLAAVSTHGAWCVPGLVPTDPGSGQPAPTGRLDGAQLLLVRPDRPTRSVSVEAPVTGACSHGGDLYLAVEAGRGTTWLRLAAEQPVPSELSLDGYGTSDPPPFRASDGDGGRLWGTRWLPRDEDVQDPGRRPAIAEEAGGVRWRAGWDRDRPALLRMVQARARDADDRERFRVDVGPGDPAAMLATPEHLWLSVEMPRQTGNYTAPTPTSLVRVHARTGAVETVVPADAIDITEHGWPLPTEPVDAADYAAFSSAQFTGLGTYWTDPDGATFPLAEGVSDSRVKVVGHWPDTALQVTFAHAARPGVRLRHTVSLYDELGRPVSARYAAIYLMEDLETGALPDVGAAQDGYLDI